MLDGAGNAGRLQCQKKTSNQFKDESTILLTVFVLKFQETDKELKDGNFWVELQILLNLNT